jgi:hypothetical protein
MAQSRKNVGNRRTIKRNKSKNRSGKRARQTLQRGGNGYGYSESLYRPVNALAPVMAHTSYSTCSPQRGGCGCGAQLQRGGGSDGYYSNVADNTLGKVPIYGANPCVQRGGNAAQQYGVASYSAGYGFSPMQTGATSVPFMDTVPYGNSCMGGARKKRNTYRRK